MERSGGTGKGKVRDVPDDQIVLRRDSLRESPDLKNDQRALAVLGVSEHKPDLAKWQEHTTERPRSPSRG